MSKGMKWCMAGVLAWLAVAQAPQAVAAADGLTLFAVPARYSVIQVMFDVLRRRDAVLVSYQGNPKSGTPLLHAWNGSEWVYVSMADFCSAAFVRNRPTRVVLVGEASVLPPALAEAAGAWCPVVASETALDTPTLVNTCGKLLGFEAADWQWFAARYKMDLTDTNEGRRKDSYYYHPFVEPSRAAAPLRTSVVEDKAAMPPAAPAATNAPPKKPEPAPAFAPNAMWEKPEPAPAPAAPKAK